ncbi:MAG TPA: DinB family protein [Cyclobacteriaceae bacterium]|nr:DinB family protein [Cyclobacteriaceae bacterium]
MIEKSITKINYLIGIIPDLLKNIPDSEFSNKPATDKWSKKEILGHLIDSATNNHHRFVRLQFENEPLISYDQNKWNEYSRYNELDKNHLIKFWTLYNTHLIELIKRIPESKYNRKVRVKEENFMTLELLVEDYVRHMEHHLKQMVNY